MWRLLQRQRYKTALLAWLVVGLVSRLSGPVPLGWIVPSVIGFGLVASKQDVTGAARFFLANGRGVLGLVKGLRTPTPDAEGYPLDGVEVVREGPVHARGRRRPRLPNTPESSQIWRS